MSGSSFGFTRAVRNLLTGADRAADSGGHAVESFGGGDQAVEMAVRVHQVDGRSVVHQIVPSGPVLRVIDLVGLGDRGDLLGRTGQPNDRLREGGAGEIALQL